MNSFPPNKAATKWWSVEVLIRNRIILMTRRDKNKDDPNEQPEPISEEEYTLVAGYFKNCSVRAQVTILT